jgi:hypothetical protein
MDHPALEYENPRRRRNSRTWYVVALAVVVAAALAVIVLENGRWRGFFRRSYPLSPRKETFYAVMSLRSQVALFKLQHNDRLPGVYPLVIWDGPVEVDTTLFWAQMTEFTDIDGNTSPTKTATHVYGPYFQTAPLNLWTRSRRIASAAGPGVGFVYDYAGGTGTGKVWGVDESGTLISQ